MLDGPVNRNGCSERPTYVARREDGQNAYIEGPGGEIVLEVTQPSQAPFHQWAFAQLLAELLNDHDLNHGCSREGKRTKASYVLHLIERNHICGLEPMEFINVTVEDAGVAFAGERLRQHDDVPF